NKESLKKTIFLLENANTEFKKNVPHSTAGLKIVDDVLEKLKDFKTDGKNADELLDELQKTANIEIIAGVEESNGYGEFGYYDPIKDSIQNSHICEKDGSLAAYEFLELLAYGKSKKENAYDMYNTLTKQIGMVGTDNRFLLHPGLKGVDEKINEIEFSEKVFSVLLQKELDNKQTVELFDGRYKLKEITIYRDGKYDNNYLDFPEEGIQMILETKNKSSAIITIRPSGTGDSIRVYSWIMGKEPKTQTDIEKYRNCVESEFRQLADDFFNGYLVSLREKGIKNYMDVVDKITGKKLRFTKEESALKKIAYSYALKKKDNNFNEKEIIIAEEENHKAWSQYISSMKNNDYANAVNFYINDNLFASIPKALCIGWKASLSGYIAYGISKRNLKDTSFRCDDASIICTIDKNNSSVIVR
ncbi:MAG: hypothetical protein KAQ92_03830, partial [Candidatus Aenigmarchaeota archaeon]|nr:hypothetical protein [Candidatus Aenigmarchaeota archaeon]